MEQNDSTQTKKLTGTQENVIVGVVAVMIAVLLLTVVKWDNIKIWFSNPIVWRDPEGITAEVFSKKETSEKTELTIFVYPNIPEKITSYDLDIVCDGAVYRLKGSYYGFGEFVIKESISVKKDGKNADFYKAISGKDEKDIKLKVHVRELYNSDEKLVKQTGLAKIIILAVISVGSGILVAGEFIKNQWLRMLLKLLCVPTLVVLVAVFIIFSAAGSSGSGVEIGSSVSDDNARSRAAENFKRQSSYKAGAVMTGRPQDAARAQGQMDKSFADMISPGDSQAKRRYQSEAGLKAGAVMTGRPEDAARAQGQMDRALADMIAANNSQAKKEYQKWAQHKASAEMHGNKRDADFAQRQMDRYMADMLQGK